MACIIKQGLKSFALLSTRCDFHSQKIKTDELDYGNEFSKFRKCFLKLPIIGYPWYFNVFVNMLARIAFVSCHTDSVKLNTGQYQDTGFVIVRSIHMNNILWTYPANRQPLGMERCILFIFEFLLRTYFCGRNINQYENRILNIYHWYHNIAPYCNIP